MKHVSLHLLRTASKGHVFYSHWKKKILGFIYHEARTKWKGEMNDYNEEFCKLCVIPQDRIIIMWQNAQQRSVK